MRHFRVKFGFGKDDFISVPEEDLPIALQAQADGTVATFDEGTVAGNAILAILPDYQRDMGWNRDYELAGEDYRQIGDEETRLYLQAIADAQRVITGGHLKQLT